jgi:type IV secretory pathway VirJ component
MSAELHEKIQNTLWWIASIATSVLCCAALFVLFASYLMDVKTGIKENNERISIIEDREDRILTEIGLIRKHAVFQSTQQTPPSAGGVSVSSDPPPGIGVEGQSAEKSAAPVENQPVSLTPAVVPATPATVSALSTSSTAPVTVAVPAVAAPTPAAGAPAAPQIAVPAMSAQPEKK